ncbi:hypothetical protein FDG04_07235 [Clostridium sporogenes]|uniref:hypothetical protein n=1 Tax=Clostridium sporogenes TaxID=1509 RepID=UPI0013CFF08A|nr:hypothetical protein [Clostridium sporogenes]NFQ85106.1 hypothetical protein [Clostridium sporogenes]
MNNKDRQKVADKKWIEKNREHATYLRNRSSARSFIRNKATTEDLEELQKLIEERKELLKQE